MKSKFILILLCLGTLSGCCSNSHCFKNYCQKDYWGDTQYEIFGRKNCVGSTGVWHDANNGRSGYYCTSPECNTKDDVTCADMCDTYPCK